MAAMVEEVRVEVEQEPAEADRAVETAAATMGARWAVARSSPTTWAGLAVVQA